MGPVPNDHLRNRLSANPLPPFYRAQPSSLPRSHSSYRLLAGLSYLAAGKDGYVGLAKDGTLSLSIIILVVMLICVIGTIAGSKWKMSKKLGFIMFCLVSWRPEEGHWLRRRARVFVTCPYHICHWEQNAWTTAHTPVLTMISPRPLLTLSFAVSSNTCTICTHTN